jgi:Na+-transporting NADH:ubiquinone oxidoreductase subunit F
VRFLRSLHKWLGLVVGAQLILWTISGFMFAWLDHHEVMGEHSLRTPEAARLPPGRRVSEPSVWLAQYAATDVHGITLLPLLSEWFWRIQLPDRIELRRADTGERFTLEEGLVRGLAQQRYAGNGRIAEVVHHADETLEARDAGPVWAVRFEDDRATTLYFSAADGRFVTARNDTWRLFDVFWMLHTMDYRGRDNFNNPLVIFAGTGALWLGLSGFILLFRAFRAWELNPIGWFRPITIPLQISARGKIAREIALPASESLYTALKFKGIDLPSNCGGGGSCGLCVVRFEGHAPAATSEERHFIPKADLACGYRLACRHAPAPATVELPDSALKHRDWSAKLVETSQLTPTIKELRLKVPQDFAFRAGDYLQVEIPAQGSAPSVRRAYSMANAPQERPGTIVLNVRLAAAPSPKVPGGAGSSFLFNAVPGARLHAFGPFGTFHAQDNNRPMIFIGGGAGMAPIRSIIVDQLRFRRTTREIHYWYGARSPEELYYAEDMSELAREFMNFKWHPAYSEAAGDTPATHVGHVHEIVRREHLSRRQDAATCDWYLCGPPRMLEACRKMLKAAGVPDEQVYFDDFGN